MITPAYKIRVKKGKVKVSSEKLEASETIAEPFLKRIEEIKSNYFNLLVESYTKEAEEDKEAFGAVLDFLLNPCITAHVSDAYIIIEDKVEEYAAPISVNFLNKKVTLAFKTSSSEHVRDLGKIFCTIKDKIKPILGFTLKLGENPDIDAIKGVLEEIQSDTLYEITILSSEVEFFKDLVELLPKLNYYVVLSDEDFHFIYQKNMGYSSIAIPIGRENSSLTLKNKILRELITKIDYLELYGDITPGELEKIAKKADELKAKHVEVHSKNGNWKIVLDSKEKTHVFNEPPN